MGGARTHRVIPNAARDACTTCPRVTPDTIGSVSRCVRAHTVREGAGCGGGEHNSSERQVTRWELAIVRRVNEGTHRVSGHAARGASTSCRGATPMRGCVAFRSSSLGVRAGCVRPPSERGTVCTCVRGCGWSRTPSWATEGQCGSAPPPGDS